MVLSRSSTRTSERVSLELLTCIFPSFAIVTYAINVLPITGTVENGRRSIPLWQQFCLMIYGFFFYDLYEWCFLFIFYYYWKMYDEICKNNKNYNIRCAVNKCSTHLCRLIVFIFNGWLMYSDLVLSIMCSDSIATFRIYFYYVVIIIESSPSKYATNLNENMGSLVL